MRKSLLFAAIFVGLSAVSGNAQASGQIYLLRGLAGIFSTGLDALDGKLVQRGFNATVHGYDYYEGLAKEAAQLQKSGKGPIVIIGHSLGADAAIFMAEKMKAAGAPVALVVTFGPTVNSGGTIECIAGHQLLYGQHHCDEGPRFQGNDFQRRPQLGS